MPINCIYILKGRTINYYRRELIIKKDLCKDVFLAHINII